MICKHRTIDTINHYHVYPREVMITILSPLVVPTIAITTTPGATNDQVMTTPASWQLSISRFAFLWFHTSGFYPYLSGLLNMPQCQYVQQPLVIEAETKWPPFRRRHFQMIFQNENVWISIKISLKFVPKAPINNIPSLVQIMAWRRPGDKPLSEPMMVSLLTHICVTRVMGWVNALHKSFRNNWYDHNKAHQSTTTRHAYFMRHIIGLILGLRLANERRRYFVTTSLIGWVLA